jgi:hypothetical protein
LELFIEKKGEKDIIGASQKGKRKEDAHWNEMHKVATTCNNLAPNLVGVKLRCQIQFHALLGHNVNFSCHIGRYGLDFEQLGLLVLCLVTLQKTLWSKEL